jgi:aspartyl-tRNA synthetase
VYLYNNKAQRVLIALQIFQISEWMNTEAISQLGLGHSGVLDAFILPTEISPEFVSSWLNSQDGKEHIEALDGTPVIVPFSSEWQSANICTKRFDHDIAKNYGLQDDCFLIVQPRQQKHHTGGSTALGRLRLALHKAARDNLQLAEQKLEGFDFLWVTDFPLFSPSNDEDPGQGGEAGLSSTHHPFTAPKSVEDVELLESHPELVKAAHYDLVVNGVELGGGSRRIHIAPVQEYILRNVLRMPENRIGDFKHLLDVLSHGCPPHAGIALGFDRLVAVMLGLESVRDVIAFPKTGSGEDLLVKSPNLLTNAQLDTYHLRLKD